MGDFWGNVVYIQAWALRRLISTYNYLIRRPHIPRERPLRRIMISQGINIELDPSPPLAICDQQVESNEDNGELDDYMEDEQGEEEMISDDDEVECF